MQTYQVEIEGISPYSQSKFVDKDEIPKIGKEGPDEYERRTWKNRVHVDEHGTPYIPPMALKKALQGASPYLGKIPGQRNATYTKRVKSGVLVTERIQLFKGRVPITFDDFKGEWLFLDANGASGGTRVKRCMPVLLTWSARATLYVADEVITTDVLERLLTDAGMFVGIGRFRPENGGYYGRFKLVSLTED